MDEWLVYKDRKTNIIPYRLELISGKLVCHCPLEIIETKLLWMENDNQCGYSGQFHLVKLLWKRYNYDFTTF